MQRHHSTAVRTALAAALVLGLSAWATRRLTQRALARTPPHGRFVIADGVRLHYTEHGDPRQPPLVLVHGNGAMAREMEISGLTEMLARDFHVVVFDRPGYGHSERPDGRSYTPQAQAGLLLAAIAQLGIERPIVLGHSWGAMVALAMGLTARSRVRALVLVSGYYTPSVRLDTVLLGAPALPVLGTLMRHTIAPLLGRLVWPLMLWRIFAPAPVTERFKREYPTAMALRPGQLLASAAEAGMMTLQSFGLKRREHELRVPTVIVAGERDRLVMTGWQSRRLHERLHEHLHETALHVVPGAGHMVHHTAPAGVAQAVREAHRMSSRRAGVAPAMADA